MEEMLFGQTLRDLYTRKVGTDKRNGRQGMSLSKLRELVMDREAWRAVIHRVTKSWT